LFDERGQQVIGKVDGIPLQVVLLAGLYFLICSGDVSAQRGENVGPTAGRIISIEPKEPEGALKVRQAKQLKTVNAAEGMLVRRGYLLILDPTARATVICGDGKRHDLQPGAHGCPCTQPCTPVVCGINYGGSLIGPMRGPDTDTGLYPVVIAPRTTLLGNLRPTIRWKPIAGATAQTTYHVTLYADRMKALWTKDVVAQTRLAYPDNAPPLAPGQTYKVVVTVDGQGSQQDRSPGLGFTTLTAEQARWLADAERQRKQLQLPETATRFLIANLYAARELNAEAIEQLEALYPTMHEAAVVRLLGDLYAVTGLIREAEKRYVEALSLTPADDLEGLGLTRKSLVQVYEGLGLFDRAMASLAEAKKAYRRLGNAAMLRALLKDERRLKQPFIRR
jgi:hypothetical protein